MWRTYQGYCEVRERERMRSVEAIERIEKYWKKKEEVRVSKSI